MTMVMVMYTGRRKKDVNYNDNDEIILLINYGGNSRTVDVAWSVTRALRPLEPDVRRPYHLIIIIINNNNSNNNNGNL